MACKNEWCDPETGNDCAECFAKRLPPERLSYDQAIAIRSTPEFQALERQIREVHLKLDGLYAELRVRFPLDENFVWHAYGLTDINLMPCYAERIPDYL